MIPLRKALRQIHSSDHVPIAQPLRRLTLLARTSASSRAPPSSNRAGPRPLLPEVHLRVNPKLQPPVWPPSELGPLKTQHLIRPPPKLPPPLLWVTASLMIISACILTITTTNDLHQQLRTLQAATKTPRWVRGAVAVAFGEISHLFKHLFGVKASSSPVSFLSKGTQRKDGWKKVFCLHGCIAGVVGLACVLAGYPPLRGLCLWFSRSSFDGKIRVRYIALGRWPATFRGVIS